MVKSSAPAQQPPPPRNPQPQMPPADGQKVAFKLGGSEEADLDINNVESKDIDPANGEK